MYKYGSCPLFFRKTVSLWMAINWSKMSLQSPFSHRDVYGTDHPTFGAICVRKTTASTSIKHKSKKSKKSSSKSSSAKKSVTSSTSIKSGHTKKSKNAGVSAKSSKTHEQTVHRHSIKPCQVTSSTKALAKVDSPVLTSHFSSHKSISRSLSETTSSGYSSSKPHLITSSSVLSPSNSNSTLPTSDVILSLNKSQDRLKSNGLTFSLNTSLKKASKQSIQAAGCLPFSRTFSSSPSRPGLKTSHGRRGGSLTPEDIAWGLGRLQYRNIIVMSGAGISTSSGIPDFRSPGTGLYDNLQQYKIPDPTAIFDIGYFSRNPNPFFTLAKELFPGKYQPNSVHYFVRLLQEKGLLLRNYTQNIDGLERIAGISPSKLVEAHGSFSTASCIKCKSKQEPERIKTAIFDGKVPRCKHKYCLGLVKPDIVFFGEDLPPRFHSLQRRDFSKCDLLIIMGTSLEVEPFASLCTLPRFDVPRLLINRELVGPFKHGRKRITDVALTGDLIDAVTDVATQAGWIAELQHLAIGKSDEAEKACTLGSEDLDVETVVSESTFSSVSVESEPALLSPVSSSLLALDSTDHTSTLTAQLAALNLQSNTSKD